MLRVGLRDEVLGYDHWPAARYGWDCRAQSVEQKWRNPGRYQDLTLSSVEHEASWDMMTQTENRMVTERV